MHRDRRDQQRVALVGEDREREHRQHEQNRKPARDATARVEDESDRDRIDAGIDQRDDAQARPVQAPGNDEEYGRGEVRNAGGEK